MQHRIVISSLEELGATASRFIEEMGEHRLVAFNAPMGAGKTTFITAVCKALGVDSDAVSSPTFSIVNEYRGGGGESIYHFDFYRISRLEEAYDIGIFDYLDSGALCLMEWPENVEELLPEETVTVSIEVRDDGSRVVSWQD